ncbi:MAG: cobalamin B12-binding domain-containing protein [Nitrospirae bacterium]|nr:cobalamin B12-binding domain-containing protein [Nitrospirota bacterium]
MAKVLFINPIVRAEDVPRHVPYGMALLAALAMRNGHQVQVYDANAWRLGDEVLRQVLEADGWDVVATGGITTTYGYVRKIGRLSKEFAPRALRVLGGGILTAMPREIMRLLPEFDLGVVGEAFQTFPELLSRLGGGQPDPSGIDGLIYRSGDGRLAMTRPRDLLRDLDTLPFPAYDLFPLEEVYFRNSQALFSEEGMMARRRLDINASYGCSLVCKFCFHLGLSGDMKYVINQEGERDVSFDLPGSYTRDIRYHSPRYVVNLARHLRERYQVDFIGFLDENLMTMDQTSGRTWLSAICDLWIGEGLQPKCVREGVRHGADCEGMHWSGTSHATLCTPEILRKMRQSGCSHLVYGYESFSKRILKTLGKGATPETNIRSFHWTIDAGIRPIPNQMMGFPTEDFDSLMDNVKAWEELGLVVKPFFATPYPGSEWYAVYKDRILEQYGGDLEAFLLDLGDATKISAVISERFSALELYGLRELMVRFDFKRLAEVEQRGNDRRSGRGNGVAETGHDRPPASAFPSPPPLPADKPAA